MSEAEFATLSSMYIAGGFLGAMTSGQLNGGRLSLMRAISLFFLLGSAIETLAGSVLVMSFGRFIAGIGAGAAGVVGPLYIKEIAPPEERGLFGTMTQVFINLGILITQVLGYYLSRGSMWRIILSVGGGLAVIQFMGLLGSRESPIWLANNGHPEAAKEVLERIRSKSGGLSEESTDVESAGLLANAGSPIQSHHNRGGSGSGSTCDRPMHQSTKNNAVGFYQLLRDPLYRPAITAVVGVMLIQQFTGINSIMMYSVSLLQGVLPISSSLLTIGISILNLVVTVACAGLPDKIGRKKALLISIAGMGLWSLILAIALRTQAKLLAAISVLAFVASFATGLGPVAFILPPELVHQEASDALMRVALGSSYLGTFIVAQFFPLLNTFLNEKLGGKGWVYFIFAATGALSFVFVGWKVPETKGKKDADEVWKKVTRAD